MKNNNDVDDCLSDLDKSLKICLYTRNKDKMNDRDKTCAIIGIDVYTIGHGFVHWKLLDLAR